MKMAFLALTALSVSADSFFGGLALCIKNKCKIKTVFGVLSAVLTLCLLGSTLGKIFGEFLKNYAEILGGAILIITGVLGLIKKEQSNAHLNGIKNDASIKDSLLIGFSIGLDGAVGSFTLTASGYNGLFVAIFITFIHAVLLILAMLLANKINKKLTATSKIPHLILILLGIYKIAI